MTTSLWCVKAADHPKVMDLTKAERCDWSNRSVMIEKNQSWQTDAQPQLLLDTWTVVAQSGLTDRLVGKSPDGDHSFSSIFIC